MNFLTKLFQNKVDKYLSCDRYFNPVNSPDSLIKLLKNSQERKYLGHVLNSKTTNIFKVMKRLSVCSMLLIHSDKFYDLIDGMDLVVTGNKWIDSEFIVPYHRLIKKICASKQMYEKTKRRGPIQVGKNVDLLFYNIGLVKLVFKVVQKMALLGRYYKSKDDLIVSNFIYTLAVHAQKIYMSIRVLLAYIIENHKVHLPTRDHELIMKTVLCEQLPHINEQMKKLFLDKYFYPLGKGIGIKLFKPQQQQHASKKTIQGIMSEHQNTNREREKYQLQITLFPQPGKVNLNFYQQTLYSGIQQNNKYDQEVQDIDIGLEDIVEVQVSMEKQNKNDLHPTYTQKVSESEIETGLSRKMETLREV